MLKIQDNFSDGKSASDEQWDESMIRKLFREFRTGAPIPKGIYKNGNMTDRICEMHGLKGIQYGNWLTMEDRYNYLLSLHACLYDMNKVLKFKTNNIGLSKSLAVGFGSRGIPRALAHYEGDSLIINISRYKRNDKLLYEMPKEKRFVYTGGAGSFGHEYGHFLDNVFGLFSDQAKNSNWLTTNPRSTSKKKIIYDKRKNPLRWLVEEIFEKMLWENGKPSTFQERIVKQSEYFNFRAEMFARLFEVYLSMKLEKSGIKNTFLIKGKYKSDVYLKPKEMIHIMPLMDKLILEMRNRS